MRLRTSRSQTWTAAALSAGRTGCSRSPHSRRSCGDLPSLGHRALALSIACRSSHAGLGTIGRKTGIEQRSGLYLVAPGRTPRCLTVRVFGAGLPNARAGSVSDMDCLVPGHMNHDTVDHVSAAFGPYLKGSLEAALRSKTPSSSLPTLVSDLLKQSLQHIDDALISDFIALFPSEEADVLTRIQPAHVESILNEKKGESSGYRKTARAFGGTTALVTLVDPARRHLWVANVGDCVAGRHPRYYPKSRLRAGC